MSDEEPDYVERTREERLKSLIRRDLNPKITAMAKNALRIVQEDRSNDRRGE